MVTLNRLKAKLLKARNLILKLDEIESDIFHDLESMRMDLAQDTNAENADNLEEAVTCYIQYGEFGIDNLIQEIAESLEED